MIPAITKEWVFTAAQTDFQMEAVSANEQMIVSYCQVTCANSNTVDVAVRIGLAAATLPTITNDSATGNAGMVLSHPAIARGGGAVVTNGGAPITIGAAGADLRITLTVSTGGSTRVVISYRIIDITPLA
jgi:hypothetical protein